MGRGLVVAGSWIVLLLALPEPEAGAQVPREAPAYSPLPPPPPPVAERAARPAPPRVAPPVARPAPAPVPEGGTTTTSSASLVSTEPNERSRAALDDERFSVAPLLGFGTNNLELGAGVRAGAVAFAPHLWIGGTFVLHDGTSASGTANAVRWEMSSSLIYFGAEAGYDFELGPVVVRPYAGVGPALFRVSSTAAGIHVSDTETKLLLWTGGTVLYGIPGTRFFVGGDARLLTVPAGPALGLYALGGMSF